MDIDLMLLGGFLAIFCLFTVVILLQRFQWRRKNKANKVRRIFYPSATALSLALLSLQTLAQPDLHHALEQRQSEAEDEEENGDPDDPFTQLNRQLKRIRNGLPIDSLKVPLNKRDC
jgi:cell division protein FtsB